MPHAQTQRLPVADGVTLHALVWRGGSRPPFLLVHGLSSNCRTWEAVAQRLHDDGHPVAALDLRGHGSSDKPESGYDFATLNADLRAGMAALGFDRPVVVGQSTGGNLAVELAARAPGEVAAVAGVDGGLIELQDEWPRWEDCRDTLAPPRLTGTARADVEAQIRQSHPDWEDWGVEATLANLEVLDDGTVRPWLTLERHLAILRGLWEHRPSAILGELGAPALFILAKSEDDSTRRGAERAERANSGVRVEWLSGDHDLHIQQPATVAELLLPLAS